MPEWFEHCRGTMAQVPGNDRETNFFHFYIDYQGMLDKCLACPFFLQISYLSSALQYSYSVFYHQLSAIGS